MLSSLRAVRARLMERDEGFTLVELLVSIVILGVIAAPLAGVMMGYFVNTATTTARLGESHDEQIAAAYWQQDVSSIGIHGSWDATSQSFPYQQSVSTSSTFGCALPPGSSLVVALAWSQYDSSGNATTIAAGYATQNTGTQLVRIHCVGGTVNSTATLAHTVSSAVQVTCTGGGVSGCADATGKVPTTITMTFNVREPSGKGQPYAVTLTGQRRQT